MSSKRSNERTNRKYQRERSRLLQQECREAPAISHICHMIRINVSQNASHRKGSQEAIHFLAERVTPGLRKKFNTSSSISTKT